MNNTIIILFLIVYLFATFSAAFKSRRSNELTRDYLFGKSSFGPIIGSIGVGATLFSTFTLLGIPTFFRDHGIATWVFLGITDVAFAGFMLYFGHRIRKKFAENSNKSQTGLLKEQNKISAFLYVVGITSFLIPTIAIEIKSISKFFHYLFPSLPVFIWGALILLFILFYAEIGGIKAIFRTDFIQGTIMVLVLWIVAYYSLKASGGIENLFNTIKEIDFKLLSAPGPKNLLTWQFLTVSFISICTMPFVQPQFFTRILIIKNNKSFVIVTAGLASFAFLIIFPTIFIGLRGVIYSTENIGGFIVNLLSNDVPNIVACLFIVGIIAAAMSTSDSQLFAIGTEWGAFLEKENVIPIKYVKVFTIFAGVCAYILSLTEFKSIVLFALNAFIGTSALLPLTFSLFVESKRLKNMLLGYSFLFIIVIFMKILNIIPTAIYHTRIELWFYLGMMVLFLLCSRKIRGEIFH